MDYPEFALIDGQEYPIDTDYRTAIECLELVEDDTINDFERSIGIIVMLFGENAPINENSLNMAKKYLQCGEKDEVQQARKKDMDFKQDESYIQASFMSDYKIDLSQTKMHWWMFCDLINGLTEKCVLNRVRDIRNYDLSQIKDPKTRRKMIEAKQNLALKEELTQEQQEAIDEFESLFE